MKPMTLNKLMQMLEACADKTEGNRNAGVVFRNVHGERMVVHRFEWDWIDNEISIEIGPEQK